MRKPDNTPAGKYTAGVYNTLKYHEGLTTRELGEILDADRESLCAPLLDMVNRGILTRTKNRRSPIDRRPVYGYYLNNGEGVQ